MAPLSLSYLDFNMNQQTTPLFNRFLASGIIIYGTKNDAGEMQPLGSAPVNTILSKGADVSPNIQLKDLARIQQQMQANFIQKIGFETPVTILDVVINSTNQIVFGGTDEEWNEGMVQEASNDTAAS